MRTVNAGTDARDHRSRIACLARLQRIRVIEKPTEVTVNPMAKQMIATVSSGISLPRSIETSTLFENVKRNASQSAPCITVY
jgi:hypothetical protein